MVILVATFEKRVFHCHLAIGSPFLLPVVNSNGFEKYGSEWIYSHRNIDITQLNGWLCNWHCLFKDFWRETRMALIFLLGVRINCSIFADIFLLMCNSKFSNATWNATYQVLFVFFFTSMIPSSLSILFLFGCWIPCSCIRQQDL